MTTTRAREVESLLLAMFAAVPLYFTYAMDTTAIAIFHVVMGAIVLRVALGKSPALLPLRVMNVLTVAYLPFFLVDWRLLSGSALAASAHLVLFIAVYQPIESTRRENHGQRLLTTALIFVASLATSTHITILPFVLVFAFLMLRQFIHISHVETVRALERPYAELPSSRAAAFYLAGAAVIGGMLFPLLPRVRSPFLQAMAGPLQGSASVLSESIDFTKPRNATGDSVVVARVWMDAQTRAFFAPVRLRGRLYDRYTNGEFKQTYRGMRDVMPRSNVYPLNREKGVVREMTVQQRLQRGRLFLPVGATAVTGLTARLYEGAARDTYFSYEDGVPNLTVRVATEAEPLTPRRVSMPAYPVVPEVRALAQRIVGDETSAERRAARIEQYLSRNYRYIPNPAVLGRAMSVDEFLLRDRVGHCEYFAAGMVALLTALDVPSRIAGGYYGGRYNPLGGYYAIRREDAHAWTEVWNGQRWVTFDATPPSMRPGAGATNAIRDYVVGLADSLTFVWDRYVLTFSLGDQVSLAEDLVANAQVWRENLRKKLAADAANLARPGLAAILGLVIAAAIAVKMAAGRRRPIFDALAKSLAARGIEVGPSMTMEEALRVLRAQQSDAALELEPVIAMYEEEAFSARQDRARVRAIRRKLATLDSQAAARGG